MCIYTSTFHNSFQMPSLSKHSIIRLRKMDKSNERMSLDDLYSCDDTKEMIQDLLSEEFDSTFDRLMKDAKYVKSLLATPAKKNFDKIKTQFIEYGMSMKTLEDLKNILDFLKVWDEVDSTLKSTRQSTVSDSSHLCTE